MIYSSIIYCLFLSQPMDKFGLCEGGRCFWGWGTQSAKNWSFLFGMGLMEKAPKGLNARAEIPGIYLVVKEIQEAKKITFIQHFSGTFRS